MSAGQTTPANYSYSSISRYAERVGEHHGIYNADGRADITLLLNLLGGRVEVHNGVESSHVWASDSFVIYIPQTTSQRRDRFTIAHELGHYFLHYLLAKQSGQVSFNRGGRDRAETEANVFASGLLMPEKYFTRAYRLARNATGVAWQFDVSPAAAKVRAEVLGL